MDDLYFDGEIRVAYANDLGDIKAFPQIATMKQASAEVRAINAQLGIKDETVGTFADFLLQGGDSPWQEKTT